MRQIFLDTETTGQRNKLSERNEELVGNSSENWREEEPQKVNNGNSKEVGLERELIRRCPPGWWNQMPIASGLVHSDKDRRRAVDLVHCHGGGVYDFVELKVDSNTPLFALMEILLYGLVYLVLRKEREWLPERSRGRSVFKASKIRLISLGSGEVLRRLQVEMA